MNLDEWSMGRGERVVIAWRVRNDSVRKTPNSTSGLFVQRGTQWQGNDSTTKRNVNDCVLVPAGCNLVDILFAVLLLDLFQAPPVRPLAPELLHIVHRSRRAPRLINPYFRVNSRRRAATASSTRVHVLLGGILSLSRLWLYLFQCRNRTRENGRDPKKHKTHHTPHPRTY